MRSHITGLDHVIIAVRDLDAAAETFRTLGFTLTSRGSHAEWGTANYCVMFDSDYLELLAAAGEGGPADRVRAFTAQREGLMGLVFATENAEADCLRLGVEAPGNLSRAVATAQGATMARFKAAPLPPDTTPGVGSFLCQHLTPEILRQPGWTEHANGARAVASVTALVADPIGLMPAWDSLIGPAASTATDETVTIHTGKGLVFLCRPEDLDQLHPEADEEEPPAPPAMVAMTIKVADTEAAARVLNANGVAFSRDAAGTIRIAPSEACGIFIEMITSS
ncbi:VOC family protein [Paramagnetospirillum kuznetsovii]|uniref:VOC family protein n=1 Tax=Paramagnetospirillum kuznetsovii TaxID=2053833 RepID=A0A364P110_9PROT|nr:VOC family protein [Paramagnetospirillum kuznetsovii]RAU23022.1 VOC family protein [Paramagnetospirillum kuznetsovii]